MNDPGSSSWFTSSRSDGASNCVEVSYSSDERIDVRDSKDPTGPVLTFSPDGWRAFVDGIQRGEFYRTPTEDR